jgi:hypothetical protein
VSIYFLAALLTIIIATIGVLSAVGGPWLYHYDPASIYVRRVGSRSLWTEDIDPQPVIADSS